MKDTVELAIYRGVEIKSRSGFVTASLCNFIGDGMDEAQQVEQAKAAIDHWINRFSGRGF